MSDSMVDLTSIPDTVYGILEFCVELGYGWRYSGYIDSVELYDNLGDKFSIYYGDLCDNRIIVYCNSRILHQLHLDVVDPKMFEQLKKYMVLK